MIKNNDLFEIVRDDNETIIRKYVLNNLIEKDVCNMVRIHFDEHNTICISTNPLKDIIDPKYYKIREESTHKLESKEKFISLNSVLIMNHFYEKGYDFVIDLYGSSKDITFNAETNLWSVCGMEVKTKEIYRVIDCMMRNIDSCSNSYLYWYISIRSIINKEIYGREVNLQLPSSQMKYWSKALYELNYKYRIDENIDEREDNELLTVLVQSPIN